MSTPAYTTVDRIAARVSQTGVDLFTDHAPGSGDESAMVHVIEDASEEVRFHCPAYDADALAASGWVTKVATDIAVFKLFELRGNAPPASVEKAYERALLQLAKVQDGKVRIPDVAAGKGAAPTVTTQRVHLGAYPANRTERPRSTGTAEGYKRRVDPSADAIDHG